MKLISLSANKRIIYFIVISCMVLSALMIVKLYTSYYFIGKSAQITLAKQYIEIAEDIATGLDTEVYEKFAVAQEVEDNYKITRTYLEQYRARINALFIYTLWLDESDISKVMVVSQPPNTKNYPIGYPCTLPVKQVNQAKSGHSYFTDVIEDKDYGSYLSVGAPFFSEDGKVLGVIGIDIDTNDLKQVSREVINSNMFIFVIDVLFAIVLLIVLLVLMKWYRQRMKQDLKESEKIYISELGKVMDTIKSGRHDMMNHLHIVSGLLDMQMHDKANEYLKRLTIEAKVIEMSLRIKNPILMVLFRSKWEFAQSKNIEIQFETDQNEYSRVESMDLARIYSNLLDNAIEAVEAYLGEQPKLIRVICKTVGEKYVFAVENPAQLTAEEQRSLFNNGYTTKENIGTYRGNGLMIIKRTVEIYKGDIYFQYEKGKVFIQITI